MMADVSELFKKLGSIESPVEGDIMSKKIAMLVPDFERVMRGYDSSEVLEVLVDRTIGSIKLLPFSQGVVNNSNLFGPHELVIFKRYAAWIRASLVRRGLSKVGFIDIGANVGLHSIVFDRLTTALSEVTITCIEPMDELNLVRADNFRANRVRAATHLCGAVVPESFNDRSVAFIKCLDNLTASTTLLSGKSIYGEKLECFVPALKPSSILSNYIADRPLDLLIIKVDIEGSEASFLEDTLPKLTQKTDLNFCLAIEVSSGENALKIFKLLKGLGGRELRSYSDLTPNGYDIRSAADIPSNWSHGSMYIESKNF